MASITLIRARRAEISQQLARLKAEDDELAIVEQVLSRFSNAVAGSGGVDGGMTTFGPAPVPGSTHTRLFQTPRSQREYVLDALATSDEVWLRSNEIITQARKRWGVTISERSLRPLLSVMKRDGQIVRQGRVLALRERMHGADKARRTPR
jgi:hypothetical protein